MKELMMQLLMELLKDSKKSDREIAKVLGVSQATVSRTRNRLLKDGLIKEFTIIPDFTKMGFEILAITAANYKVPRSKELIEKGTKWMNKHPNIIFGSKSQGMGKDSVMISLHRNYAEYDMFINDLVSEMGELIETSENMLVNLKGFVVKPLSLARIAKLFEK